MEKQYFVYILTNATNTVTYTGVTNDLYRRIPEHRMKINNGFTARYRIYKLVYFEVADNVESAIMREKQIKSWSRTAKVKLITEMNPDWHDLYKDIMGD